jgi:hypothetical protein
VFFIGMLSVIIQKVIVLSVVMLNVFHADCPGTLFLNSFQHSNLQHEAQSYRTDVVHNLCLGSKPCEVGVIKHSNIFL